jgi:hypothetical protein
MTDIAAETSWLLDGIDNLVRLKQQFWLTEAEIAIIERGISAIDRLLGEPANSDRNTPRNPFESTALSSQMIPSEPFLRINRQRSSERK